MTAAFPPAFFVTGTDTDVGKSVVCAILTLGLNAVYWKPIQSGLQSLTDTQWIQRHTELGKEHFLPESYRLTQPLSPHISAALDGVSIDLENIKLPAHFGKHLIVEGAGGVMVPINSQHMMIDLIQHLDLPVLIVARSCLGTINHTLLTIERLRKSNIQIMGVVLNGPRNTANKQSIESYGQTTVIAELEPLPAINKQQLQRAFEQYFSARPANRVLAGKTR